METFPNAKYKKIVVNFNHLLFKYELLITNFHKFALWHIPYLLTFLKTTKN